MHFACHGVHAGPHVYITRGFASGPRRRRRARRGSSSQSLVGDPGPADDAAPASPPMREFAGERGRASGRGWAWSATARLDRLCQWTDGGQIRRAICPLNPQPPKPCLRTLDRLDRFSGPTRVRKGWIRVGGKERETICPICPRPGENRRTHRLFVVGQIVGQIVGRTAPWPWRPRLASGGNPGGPGTNGLRERPSRRTDGPPSPSCSCRHCGGAGASAHDAAAYPSVVSERSP